MTRPAAKVKEADDLQAYLDRLAQPVADLWTVEPPDRYATAKPDRYATAVVDRYAVAVPTGAVLAAPEPSRYDRAGQRDRYAAARRGRYGGKRPRPPQRIIVVVEPPEKIKGRLLWLPSSEYERAFDFEYSNWMDLWCQGAVLDFSEAAQAQWENQVAERNAFGEGPPDPRGMLLSASEVEDVSFTFDTDTEVWGEHQSDLWPDAMRLGQRLRERLVNDPDLVMDWLDSPTLAGYMAGTHLRNKGPTADEVRAALDYSTTVGLGAAAIDLILWNDPPSILGDEVDQLVDVLEDIRTTDWVPEMPIENFILDPTDLHIGTHRTDGHNSFWYELFGQYQVGRIDYYSDLSRSQPYGWRNAHLRPFGIPSLPDYSKDLEYPQAFIDRAQMAFGDE